MSRDQRVGDNWALTYAQEQALQKQSPLLVVFCLVPDFLHAAIRQYDFMLRGLKEVREKLDALAIPFYLLNGLPEREIGVFARRLKCSLLVCDFDPLRVKQAWKRQVAAAVDIPVHEVDAHNIVPCWLASDKQEFGAYTFRPKINRLVPEFLRDSPSVKKHPYPVQQLPPINWEKTGSLLRVDRKVSECYWLAAGEKAAFKALRGFISRGLQRYPLERNDPAVDGQSHLSPYLHFGHISAQRVALEIKRAPAPQSARRIFLEELIVRRELSDNFCLYNQQYDSFACLPAWAQSTLRAHARDRREYRYSRDDLEQARTHDRYWNAAQTELTGRGTMHGYMRMYWGKKILEWSADPAEAMQTAVYLNDKYQLDGRDPNGYAGIAWCFGMHDRAWSEREIFGKVRYMNDRGLERKFDMSGYVRRNSGA